MKEGFIEMLPHLRASMVKNGNSNNNIHRSYTKNNMMDMDGGNMFGIESKMDSEPVKDENNTNNINCDKSPKSIINQSLNNRNNGNNSTLSTERRQLDEKTTDIIPTQSVPWWR